MEISALTNAIACGKSNILHRSFSVNLRGLLIRLKFGEQNSKESKTSHWFNDKVT